jgi:hypothetical protein
MTVIIKEPVVVTPVKRQATDSQTYEYLVYYLFGALDILLAFRIVLKLLGASTASYFVKFVYSLSRIFIMPFEGIFRKGFTEGLETTSVVEPATLIAIIVYAIIAVGIVKLIRISSGEEQTGGDI